MATLEIVNSGNLQEDINNHFGLFCPIRTESWSSLKEILFVGFVRVGMSDYVIDAESAKKINTNTLQMGDVVKLQTEPTEEINRITNQENLPFESQYTEP